MEQLEVSKHRKREYIVVKHGQQYYYARADRQKPDRYNIMVPCTEREATAIVEKANASSEFNAAIDQFYSNNGRGTERDKEHGKGNE